MWTRVKSSRSKKTPQQALLHDTNSYVYAIEIRRFKKIASKMSASKVYCKNVIQESMSFLYSSSHMRCDLRSGNYGKTMVF